MSPAYLRMLQADNPFLKLKYCCSVFDEVESHNKNDYLT